MGHIACFTRIKIKQYFSEYEKRFVFHDESEFPEPKSFSGKKKEYPSQVIDSEYFHLYVLRYLPLPSKAPIRTAVDDIHKYFFIV